MADTVSQLLRGRLGDNAPAVKYGDQVWTWAEYLDDAAGQAAGLIGQADPDRPLHVGTLLGNTPQMLTAMAAAGLGGYVLAGINNTRRGEALARDIARADCQILLTDAAHRGLLDGLDLPGVQVIDVDSAQWPVHPAAELARYREPAPTDTFMLIFTSGTSGEPKPVIRGKHLELKVYNIIGEQFAFHRALRSEEVRIQFRGEALDMSEVGNADTKPGTVTMIPRGIGHSVITDPVDSQDFLRMNFYSELPWSTPTNVTHHHFNSHFEIETQVVTPAPWK